MSFRHLCVRNEKPEELLVRTKRPAGKICTWTPEFEALMEVERETEFEEQTDGRLRGCLQFPCCVELYVTCSTPAATKTLSFCGSLVKRRLLERLATVNCTVQEYCGTCDENSCAGQLFRVFAVSYPLIRPHGPHTYYNHSSGRTESPNQP